MYPKKQVFFVLGLSRSGRAATEYLLEKGSTVYVYDDTESGRVEQIIKRRGRREGQAVCEFEYLYPAGSDLPFSQRL